jgi:hypothetical protein
VSTIVSQPTPATVILEVGDVLTVTADALSSGLVRRNSQPGVQRTGPQSKPVPSANSRAFGPFPTVRHYSIEPAAGTLSYVVGRGDYDYSTLLGNVEGFTGSITLEPEDNGKLLRCDDASAVTITVLNTLPVGFNIGFTQWGAGSVTIAAGASATSRSTASSASAQYKIGTVLVVKNSDGASAEFTVNGEVT